jgi:hypothetical protein
MAGEHQLPNTTTGSGASAEEKNIWRFVFKDILLSWQAVTFVAMFCVFPVAKSVFERANNIKIGEFQMSVSKLAIKAGLSSDDLKSLNQLTYEELKVFLIEGGQDAEQYKVDFANYTYDSWLKIHQDLQSLGLLEIKKDVTSPNTIVVTGFEATPTEKGKKIHRAIVDAIFKDFLESRVEGTER